MNHKLNFSLRNAISAGLFLLLSATASGQVENAENQTIDNLIKALARWGTSVDARLISFDLFGHMAFHGGYEYKVEPAFNDGLWLREDRYYFSPMVRGTFKDRLAEDRGAIYITPRISQEIETSFLRLYDNPKHAYAAIPYFVQNLPVTASRALKNLKPGDIFKLKSRLNLVVTGGFLTSFGVEGLALNVSGHYLLSGEFQIHVLRMKDDKIRLKIIGFRTDEKGASLAVGYQVPFFEVTGVEYIDKRITRILDLNPIRISLKNSKQTAFMVDYVLDLKDAEIQDAYKEVFRSTYKYKDGALLNPWSNFNKLKNVLTLDILPLEAIFKKDNESPIVNERIIRNYKGGVDLKRIEAAFRVNLRVIGFRQARNTNHERMSSIDKDEITTHYLLESYNASQDYRFFFSWINQTYDRRFNTLFITDKDFRNPVAESIVYDVERKDKRFRFVEFESVQSEMLRTIPGWLVEKMEFSDWDQNQKKKLSNVAVRYHIVIPAASMALMPELSEQEIYERYLAWAQTIPVSLVLDKSNMPAKHPDPDRFTSHWHFRLIARTLAKVFDRSQPLSERLKILMDIRKDDIWAQTGIGFLLSLLPEGQLEDLIRFDFNMSSSDQQKLEFSFGKVQFSEVYQRVRYINSIIFDEDTNFYLEAETLKRFEQLQ